MDKGLAEVFFPLLRQGGNIAVLGQFKIGLRLSRVKEKKSFQTWRRYTSVVTLIYIVYLNSYIMFTHPSSYPPMQKRQGSVARCHESPCLLEPLKFQPLLCRGVPLFEASFSCQCFVQDGEQAFGMAQWWGRVHLGSNDRLKCTSAASRFWSNLWTDSCCIQDKSDFNDI